MSTTEGFLILDSQNATGTGDKAAKPWAQSMARRKLADISNLPQKPRPPIQEEKPQSNQITTKDYIEQLQKENLALVKMLAQRNKIIEQSGIELERLRVNLIKVKEQNQQLALSHTQMLAELNLGKDRLKALQHELACKNGLLKVRKLELEEKASMRPCQHADVEVNLVKLREEGKSSKGGDDEKPRNNKRRLRSHSLGSSGQSQSEENAGNKRPFMRRQSARFKTDDAPKCPASDEPLQSEENAGNKRPFVRRQSARFMTDDAPKCPLSDEPLQSEENAGNKRPFFRRQSARFKAVESKASDNSFETGDAKLPACPLPKVPSPENGSTSVSSSLKSEDNRSSYGSGCESQELGRSSLCRPSRVAAKKVQSYKEIPLNVKMRRSE